MHDVFIDQSGTVSLHYSDQQLSSTKQNLTDKTVSSVVCSKLKPEIEIDIDCLSCGLLFY